MIVSAVRSAKRFFLIQTLGQIQQMERYVRAIKTVNVTGGDSNETRKTNCIVFNVVFCKW